VITDHPKDSAEWVKKDQQIHFSRRLWPTVIKDIRSSGSGGQIVTMMQPAELWHRHSQLSLKTDPLDRVGVFCAGGLHALDHLDSGSGVFACRFSLSLWLSPRMLMTVDR
jgi:hypothetical protein